MKGRFDEMRNRRTSEKEREIKSEESNILINALESCVLVSLWTEQDEPRQYTATLKLLLVNICLSTYLKQFNNAVSVVKIRSKICQLIIA